MWDAIKAAFSWVADNWPTILAIITGPIGIAVLMITKNWDKIKDTFNTMVDTIKRIAGTIYDFLAEPFRLAYDAIKLVIDKIPGVFTAAVSGVTNALSTIWQVISDPFKERLGCGIYCGQSCYRLVRRYLEFDSWSICRIGRSN